MLGGIKLMVSLNELVLDGSFVYTMYIQCQYNVYTTVPTR